MINEWINKVIEGDAFELINSIDNKSINCSISSPPYFNLRSYLSDNDPMKIKEFGNFQTPEEYVNKLVLFYIQIYRVLKDDGTVFVNLGDCYLNKNKKGIWIKSKQLALIPSRFAIAMQGYGWILRNKIIWHKGNCLSESVKDRFVNDYEEVLLFVKNKKYYFNQLIEPFASSSNPNEIYTGKATKNYELKGAQNPSDTKRRILERMKIRGGRSMRSVWRINTRPTKSSSHTATFPDELVKRMVNSGCPDDGIILDPFCGTNTVGVMALKNNKKFIGFELNHEDVEFGNKRIL